MSSRVVVVGAGAGACAIAVDMSVLGYEVLMLNRSRDRLEDIEAADGIRAVMEGEDYGVVPIYGVTTDPYEALGFSTTVVMVVPTTALSYYADAIGPAISAEHKILLVPGHTGGALYFRRAAQLAGAHQSALIGETHTLPYVCRKTGVAEVTVWKRNSRVLAAALPASANDSLANIFREIVPGFVLVHSVLETSLNNTNAVMHPPGMILNAGWIEQTKGGFKFYAEGHPPAVGRVIDDIDRERLDVGRAFGLSLKRWIDVFFDAGYTTEAAWRSGLASNAIVASEPNKEIKAPESLEHRYVREDFGYGLVPIAGLAKIAGVATPVTDSLITLGSAASAADLIELGLSNSDMGIDDMSIAQIAALVEG